MGKKKGKKYRDAPDQSDAAEGEDVVTEDPTDSSAHVEGSVEQPSSEPSSVSGRKGGGKKGKKKQEWDDDFDMESALAEVQVADPPVEGKQQTAVPQEETAVPVPLKDEIQQESTTEDPLPSEPSSAKGKKVVGKKGKKKKQDWDEDFDMESALAVVQVTENEKQKISERSSGEAQQPQVAGEGGVGPRTEIKLHDSAQVEPPPVDSLQPSVLQQAEEAEEVQEEDKKKKKKKKKGTTEKEEKKPAKKTVVGTAIKKRLEAIRAAQKQREEEEQQRLAAEEEAERRRLEQLRLEEEKKQKQKQKEKEKRDRLKKEGKWLTKSERERKSKQQAHLEALKAQGVDIPGLRSETQGERRPVRYGSRARPNRRDPRGEGEGGPEVEVPTGPEEGKEVIREESGVVDDWEDLDDVAEDVVKENWDDSEGEMDGEGEGDEKCKDPVSVPPTRDKEPVRATVMEQEADVADEGDSDVSDESESDSDSEDESLSATERQRAKVLRRLQKRFERADAEQTVDILRSPVLCVLGHVDTGKTKILDKIRRTNVQDGEAGGITQQIGATFVPQEAVRGQTVHLKEFSRQDLRIPGLLIIDTPGHESFSNLRTRGSSLCDLAVLVVDIMHGLEPQTIESINILKRGKVPFVVALNKVDRLLDWKRNPSCGIRDNLKKQKPSTSSQFDELYKQVVRQFAEQELNVALFWDKVNFKEYVPVCPTSAISGDGTGDLMALLVTLCHKQLLERLQFSENLECHVLEVKSIPGLGMTVDVILRNGFLQEGDTLVLCGVDGPFTTQVRALLTPQPLRELRIKGTYIQHKQLAGAQGVKVTGKDLDKALAGTPVFVAKHSDEVEVLKDNAKRSLRETLNAIKCQEFGVYVQASTLGSLEALVEFLNQSKIPYFGVNIGPVHKRDVMKASVMLEHKEEYAVILAFDIRVEREAQEYADSVGVRIFSADIIYHLFDRFLGYREELKQRLREQYKDIAVFPCKLKILPNCVFNKRDPIVVGVHVQGGVVKQGTPLTVPTKEFCDVGVVTSLELNHKPVESARKGQEVCIKIEPIPGEAPRLIGRHFDETDLLVSKVTRQSINAVKEYFREDLQKSDWQLMVELKKQFHIL